jgi:hypothetical protein
MGFGGMDILGSAVQPVLRGILPDGSLERGTRVKFAPGVTAFVRKYTGSRITAEQPIVVSSALFCEATETSLVESLGGGQYRTTGPMSFKMYGNGSGIVRGVPDPIPIYEGTILFLLRGDDVEVGAHTVFTLASDSPLSPPGVTLPSTVAPAPTTIRPPTQTLNVRPVASSAGNARSNVGLIIGGVALAAVLLWVLSGK